MKWFVVVSVIFLSGCASLAEKFVDSYLSHPDSNRLHETVKKCNVKKEC